MHTQLSQNTSYVMHHAIGAESKLEFLSEKTLKTIFVHDGCLELEIQTKSKTEDLKLDKDQGVILMPEVGFQVKNFDGSIISAQSERMDKPIIEIVDRNNVREERTIIDFKKISNPKKVIKPWGHEIWISWFKNHHVLKRIFMTEGNKCSLQFHEEKSETNFIVSGKADVLKGIYLRKGISERDALEQFKNVENINNYMHSMKAGDFWDNKSYEIHRVFSTQSYTAYEASTSELDDVIRIQDDNNRSSGLIESEHNT